VESVTVCETFVSVQGESSHAGWPCFFIRLSGCNLRCSYCDTEYAFFEGEKRSIEDVIAEVDTLSGRDADDDAPRCRLVEVTGGEPLLQPGVHELMGRLCDAGYTVLIETSGACDISECDARVVRIMDIKTPDSGEAERNLCSNIEYLTDRDEVKFVVCSRADYEWSREVIERHGLARRVKAVLMSPAAAMPATAELRGVEGLALRELAEWVLADRLPVVVQTQLHKLIWDPAARGV
jgi:7-carboxy-7-deazaguanine synthase